MNKRYIAICLGLFLLSACKQNRNVNTGVKPDTVENKKVSSATDELDEGEEWLKNIFTTKNSTQYFPEYNVEEKLATKRFQEFIEESGEIYGASNLTDAEYPAAEKKYKAKWSKIYPIEEREMWLFGRGNGDMGELKQVEISKIKEGIYRVFIDYGAGIKTTNEVTLVLENGAYKIDYCKTEFLN